MSNLAIYGLIALGSLAILGLGIRLHLKYKGGIKNNLKNVMINGSYAGRDNSGMDSKQDKGR